jgi:hypothetical protein
MLVLGGGAGAGVWRVGLLTGPGRFERRGESLGDGVGGRGRVKHGGGWGG